MKKMENRRKGKVLKRTDAFTIGIDDADDIKNVETNTHTHTYPQSEQNNIRDKEFPSHE